MKQRTCVSILVVVLLMILATNAFASDGDIPINQANFPDLNFRIYIVENIDLDNNYILSSSERNAVEEIYIEESSIKSLKGIAFFPKLESLQCYNNQLKFLDISKNTALIDLGCRGNQLSSLDVSKNIKLEWLDCGYNQLHELDVRKNENLISLGVDNNRLSNLILGEQEDLYWLYCENNQLTSLDVSKNINLCTLYCGFNQLDRLNLENNKMLSDFDCSHNRIEQLDISHNVELMYLHCDNNRLIELDLRNNDSLVELSCMNNRLSSIDARKCTMIEKMSCANNVTGITLTSGKTFDLKQLPGNFNINRTSNWTGGILNGSILTVRSGFNTVTYNYDCGNGYNICFTLRVVEKPAKPYKIVNTVSGVHVYWKAVEGAAKYGLWRSETGKNGTYKWIANPTVEHFTDTKVESGKTCWYKVTAMDSAGQHTAKSEAIGISYVSTPDISLRVNRAAGIGLGWEKIQGATGYAIYRKSYSGSDAWVRVATVQGGDTLSWNDTSVKNNNGTVYRYTIRALYGTTLSGCRNTGRTMTRLTSRTLSSVSSLAKGSAKVTWGTTSQATGYEVRFMVGSKVYKTFTIGNYKTGVKTFTNLPAGTYKIQVRAYKNVAGVGSFYSAWSTAKTLTVK